MASPGLRSARASKCQTTVLGGTVASAVRMIAKAELTGTIGIILPMVDHSEEILLRTLTSVG
jgi:hypothetical protein